MHIRSLARGDQLRGRIVRCTPRSAWVDANVVRTAKQGRHERMLARVPCTPALRKRLGFVRVGREVPLRVVRPMPDSARLTVKFARPGDNDIDNDDNRKQQQQQQQNEEDDESLRGLLHRPSDPRPISMPRMAEARARLGELRQRRLLSELQPGEWLRGALVSTHRFGAYVDVNVARHKSTSRTRHSGRVRLERKDGLLMRRDLPDDAALDADLVKRQGQRVLRRGDEVDVRVFSVHAANAFFRLSMRAGQLDEMAAADTRAKRRRARWRQRPTVEQLPAGQLREGVVRRVAPFGAFVDVGAKRDGLVPANDAVMALAEGERVVVRVGAVRDVGKLSLEWVRRVGESNARAGDAGRRRRLRNARALERPSAKAVPRASDDQADHDGGDDDGNDDDDFYERFADLEDI